jgi:hypothetical protein
LVKDVLLTGTGLTIIITQIWAAKPSDLLLVVGLALTVPSAASHAASVLSGPGGGPHRSSPSSPAHGEPDGPSSPSTPPE